MNTDHDENPHAVMPEPAQKPLVHTPRKGKRPLIIGACAIVVLLGIGSWFIFHQKDDIPQEDNAQKAGSVLSYEDCAKAKASTLDEEGGACKTDSGIIFYPGDDFSENEGDATEDLTQSAGDQSVRLVVGPDDAAFLWGSPYLLINDGSSSMTLTVQVITQNISLDACTLMLKSIPDKPGVAPIQYIKTPLAAEDISFIDGRHTISVDCSVDGGGDPLKITKEFGVADRRSEACADFSFSEPSSSSVANQDELRVALDGTWKGCVDTPWWPSYEATITFNQGGAYVASSEESLDGQVFGGGFYYYNIEGAHAAKVFGINAFANGVGSGFLDVIRPESNTVQRGDLRNIKLSGNNLSFDFHLTPTSKAMHFRLKKQ